MLFCQILFFFLHMYYVIENKKVNSTGVGWTKDVLGEPVLEKNLWGMSIRHSILTF